MFTCLLVSSFIFYLKLSIGASFFGQLFKGIYYKSPYYYDLHELHIKKPLSVFLKAVFRLV